MELAKHADTSVRVGGFTKYNFVAFGDEVYEEMGFELKLGFIHDSDSGDSGQFDISTATAVLEVAPFGDAGYTPVSIGSPVLSSSGGGITDTVTFTVNAGSIPTDISQNYDANASGNAIFKVTLTQGTKEYVFTQRTNLVNGTNAYSGFSGSPSSISTQRNDLGNVINMTTSTPPVTPTFGDAYIVLATGLGDWAGYDNYLAISNGTQWILTAPIEGNYVFDNNTNLRYEYDGSAWVIAALKNIVEDTTPQLGGNLGLGGFNVGTATATEIGYLSGVTSAIQTQIDTKQLKLKIAKYQDQKATTTAGGSSSAGWQTRTINTEVFDADGIASLSSNAITPIAGTYLLIASAPAFASNRHRIALHDGSSYIAYGNANYAVASTVQTSALLNHVFTANGSTAYTIQHYCQSAQATNGLGVNTSDGSTEIYTDVLLIRIGD
jgi:hypothetical protein